MGDDGHKYRSGFLMQMNWDTDTGAGTCTSICISPTRISIRTVVSCCIPSARPPMMECTERMKANRYGRNGLLCVSSSGGVGGFTSAVSSATTTGGSSSCVRMSREREGDGRRGADTSPDRSSNQRRLRYGCEKKERYRKTQ